MTTTRVNIGNHKSSMENYKRTVFKIQTSITGDSQHLCSRDNK